MVAEFEYEVPTWSQIYDMLLRQARKIRGDHYQPDVVVGIARGGLVPSCVIADLLQTPELTSVTIESYVDIAQSAAQPTLKRCLQTDVAGKRVLLVDDISDSGKTLQLAKKHLQDSGAQQIKTATLYSKPDTATTPDYFEKQTCRWIVFPWEAKETLTRLSRHSEGKRAMAKEITRLVHSGFPKALAEKLLKDDGANP